MILEPLVKTAMALGASDLHVEPESSPIIRIHGELHRQGAPLSRSDTRAAAELLVGAENWESFIARGSFDLSRTIGGVRCRINAFVSRRGIALAIRLLARRVPTLEALNLLPDLRELVEREHGLLLVSGPTGSGKSSTLAALVQEINLASRRHIITVEEPVEFSMESKLAFIQQREVRTHTPSFQQALLDVLREDPDVVMVGEMREPEVMRLTLNIAETGHLVLATVHSSNTAEAIQRIVMAFTPEQQASVRAELADALIGVISQRLQKVRDRNLVVPECEILVATAPVRNMIRQGEFHKLGSVLATGGKDGMYTWERYRAWIDGRPKLYVPDETDLAPAEEQPAVDVQSSIKGKPVAATIPAEEDVISLERPTERIADFVSRLKPPR